MSKNIIGTAFDLDAAEGTWFKFFNSRVKDDGTVEYDDPVSTSGRFCLRPIAPFIEEFYAKRKTEHEFVVNPKTRSMERVPYTKDMSPDERKEYQAALWDYVIVGFENIVDGKGKEIPCTKENKVKLMAIPALDRFVAKCLKTIAENAVKQSEILTENL